MPVNDVIRQLPESVANQIAAGEVIQRPASVIKELVENAVDAHATRIEIVLKDAGKTLIQVIDNGVGMSMRDARMAFEKHATSKIRTAQDLFTLRTMGFRGEALPSIAAIAEVEMRTKRQVPGAGISDPLGTRLVIKGGRFESCEVDVAQPGTNIMVKNLFFNIVARRRFLKKDSAELSHILREFEKLALVNTGVEFKVTHNEAPVYSLPAQTLKQRIGALFGKAVMDKIIPVEVETTMVRINGFIGLPQAARVRGAHQYLFVNGRNMDHPYFKKAIQECYAELIPKDAKPCYFINFEVDPDRIDVNIHPQKHEIKFLDDSSIWQILTQGVKTSLGKFDAGPSIEFDLAGAPDIPAMAATNAGPAPTPAFELSGFPDTEAQQRFEFPSHSSGALTGMTRGTQSKRTVPPSWQELYSRPSRLNTGTAHQVPDGATGGNMGPTDAPGNIMQLFNTYLVTETASGLLVIDQHRAHMRILYESMLDSVGKGNVPSQAMLFPENLDMEPSMAVLLDSASDLVEKMGFRYETDSTGTNARLLTAFPEALGNEDPKEALNDVLNVLLIDAENPRQVRLEHMVAILARRAAIKHGQPLSTAEKEHIVSSLFKLPDNRYTPDGRVIIHAISPKELASIFD